MNALADGLSVAERAFAHLGVADVAYVKRVVNNGHVAYAVHAADGTPIATLRDRETALAAVRQHGLEPLSVH
jgi:hypothetical protein